MEFIDSSKFKSLKKNAEQPWSTYDPGEYMSGKSMQAASESLCKRDSQWAETHAFRAGQTPDGNTVFMMVLVNPSAIDAGIEAEVEVLKGTRFPKIGRFAAPGKDALVTYVDFVLQE